jgi:hypothetical protein
MIWIEKRNTNFDYRLELLEMREGIIERQTCTYANQD